MNGKYRAEYFFFQGSEMSIFRQDGGRLNKISVPFIISTPGDNFSNISVSNSIFKNEFYEYSPNNDGTAPISGYVNENNQVDFSYSLASIDNFNSEFESFINGEGNLFNTNPLFTDPENGDFTLQISSPCIDTGDPEILDPDGSRSDMGAYYFPQESNTLSIDEGANLMSFSVLPRNGLDDLPNDISGIIGAGVAATNLPPWSGSLQELSCNDGYWLINSGSAFEWDYFGIPCSDSLIYNLNEGANLISYSNDESGSLSDVLPDDVEDFFYNYRSKTQRRFIHE